jgi:hypothetical protein
MCHPRLGAMPQSGCTSTRALVIGSTGGGGGRRRRTPSNLDSHRPCTSVVDPSDGEDLHQSTGLTPRTARAEDHTLCTSSAPSLVMPPPPTLPSTEAGPSVSGTPLDLKSLCGNQMLRQFARFASPTNKGRVPGSWDSTVGPSR